MKNTILLSSSNEPPHDKTNNLAVCPAKTLISLGIRPVWSVFSVHMKKAWVLSYLLSTQWRLWSDWADAQADLSLHWAHSHFVGFVMRSLKHQPHLFLWSVGEIPTIISIFIDSIEVHSIFYENLTYRGMIFGCRPMENSFISLCFGCNVCPC